MIKVAVLDDYQDAFKEIVEISKFKDLYKLSLGENILRAETAAISALSIVGYELN